MNECPICLEIINTEMCFLTCKCLSIYHTKCIQHWLVDNNTCPTCNKFFKKKRTPVIASFRRLCSMIVSADLIRIEDPDGS